METKSISIREASRISGSHPSYIQHLTSNGTLKARRNAAGRVRIDRKSFEAWFTKYRLRSPLYRSATPEDSAGLVAPSEPAGNGAANG